jgi:hypothetical protein
MRPETAGLEFKLDSDSLLSVPDMAISNAVRKGSADFLDAEL